MEQQDLQFSTWTRQEALRRLSTQTDEVFDAVVVGGGIVGVGTARELALRGLKVLLCEKGDFASGTSSRSSKLIHGGLRYLEMLEFGLVFESLTERHWLLETHPHLVAPLKFVLPSYTKAESPPGARNRWLLSLGLWVYDLLALFHTPFFHGWHKADEMKALFPKVKAAGLLGGLYYADAMMLDDEMVLECAYDAKRRGAELLNYVAATQVMGHEVTLEDQLPLVLGGKAGPKFTVKARQVISCVGPWTEQFGRAVAGGSGRKLRPSRGIHLVIPWQRCPVQACLDMYAPDGRVVFVIPRRDFGMGAEHVIVGTTDAPDHGDLDHIRATQADVDYLLKILNQYFPEAGLTAGDVVQTFAGVRPLLDDGAASEATTSREHEIWRNDVGVVFVAGGKYTTFRPISQEIVDFAFPHSIKRASRRFYDERSHEPLSTPEEYQQRLVGTPLWGRYTDKWVQWKLEHHAPCTLEDVVYRRFPLWMAGPQVAGSRLRAVAELCTPYFKWSPQEMELQIKTVEEKLKSGLQWV